MLFQPLALTPACDDADEPTPAQTEGRPYFTPKQAQQMEEGSVKVQRYRMMISGLVKGQDSALWPPSTERAHHARLILAESVNVRRRLRALVELALYYPTPLLFGRKSWLGNAINRTARNSNGLSGNRFRLLLRLLRVLHPSPIEFERTFRHATDSIS